MPTGVETEVLTMPLVLQETVEVEVEVEPPVEERAVAQPHLVVVVEVEVKLQSRRPTVEVVVVEGTELLVTVVIQVLPVEMAPTVAPTPVVTVERPELSMEVVVVVEALTEKQPSMTFTSVLLVVVVA